MANVPRVSDMTSSKSRLDESLNKEWKESRKVYKHNNSLFGKNKIAKEVWKNTKDKIRSL